MTPTPTTASGGAGSRSSRLLAELRVAHGFPAALLLEALRVARPLVVSAGTCSSTGPSQAGLLAGLHLDIAAVEIAHASGLAPGDQRADPLGGPVDACARSAGRLLVDRAVRVLQDHLDRDPGDAADANGFGPEQLLACTRAVLHLDAARRPWPQNVSWGRAR